MQSFSQASDLIFLKKKKKKTNRPYWLILLQWDLVPFNIYSASFTFRRHVSSAKLGARSGRWIFNCRCRSVRSRSRAHENSYTSGSTTVLVRPRLLGGVPATRSEIARLRARNTTNPREEGVRLTVGDLRARVGAWCLPPNPDKICRRDINSRIQSQQSVYVSRVGSSPRQLPSPPSRT